MDPTQPDAAELAARGGQARDLRDGMRKKEIYESMRNQEQSVSACGAWWGIEFADEEGGSKA